MCCGAVIAKYTLFIVNILFVVAGIAIIALGSVVWSNLNEIQEIIPATFIPIAIIVLGCIIFLVGFLACCGAIRESRCMLISYGSIMVVLLAFKVYLAVVVFSFVTNVQDTVSGWIDSAFNNMSLREVFYSLQYLFSCCGTAGPSSYGESPLPATCCPDVAANATCVGSNAYDGCTDIVVGWFETFGDAIGGVLISIIIFELVAIIFAFFLTHSISKNRR